MRTAPVRVRGGGSRGGGGCVGLDVAAEIADEEHAHAQHEGDTSHAHEADVGGEEILERMHERPFD